MRVGTVARTRRRMDRIPGPSGVAPDSEAHPGLACRRWLWVPQVVRGRLGLVGRGLARAWCALAGGLLAAAMMLPVADAIVGRVSATSYSGELASIPYYAHQPWTARFVADQDAIGSAKVRYEPFTVWRRPAYASETVNVGPDRQRVVPGSDCTPGARKVWFFGGSTMWGTSSPDWATIPALFVVEMRKRTTAPLCVRNFGESAWSSTQEVIALVQALQRGDSPDVAVFYDGANDLNLAYENGDPYGHAQLALVRERFDRAGRGRGAVSSRARAPRELLRWFAPNLAARLDRAGTAAPMRDGGPRRGPRDLVAEVVRVLRLNREVVRALAKRFGFETQFFWQPYLVAGRKPLAPGEERMMASARRHRGAFLSMVEDANALVAIGAAPDETDLSRVFEGISEQVFTDPVHVTPRGNELVARAMADAIGDRVASGSVEGAR